MELEQANQMKELQTKYDNENKEMKADQAKAAVDTAKEVNADKTLKTKADKDRRLKQKSENNTNRFIKERKNLAIKQGKFKDKQAKIHEQQLANLSNDIKMTIQFYDDEEKELTSRSQMEFFC